MSVDVSVTNLDIIGLNQTLFVHADRTAVCSQMLVFVMNTCHNETLPPPN